MKRKTNHPLVSVIIPVYNVEKYLNRCIESVTNQTLKEIEIILVDDASSDNSPQMCDEWAAKDCRINVVHKKNEGAGLARNSGMQYATGEYIAFIDSDDYLEPNMYEILYTKAISTNADIIYCGYKYGKKDGTFENRSDFNKETIFDKKEEIEKQSINYFYPIGSRQMMAAVWHSIYKKDVIKTDFHSEREIASEDMLFQLQTILNSNKIVYIPDCLYYYCYNEESISRKFKFNRIYGYKKLTQKVLTLYPGKEKYAYMFFFKMSISFIRIVFGDKNTTPKERRMYLREFYFDPIWKEVKENTDRTMYIKHQKIMYSLLGRKLFPIFYLLMKLDYHIIYKK